MSYDLFCYRSKLGQPDADEADAVIGADTDKWTQKDRDPATKLVLVKALTAFNPRLEAFDFDYGEIAKLTATTLEVAMNQFDHIELNPPKGDLAIQLTVYDHYVFLTVPYWYQGAEAAQVFACLKGYIKVIWQTAGYYVYDPQTGEAFDPSVNEFEGLDKYLPVSEHLDEIVNTRAEPLPAKKPWWKIW